MEAEEVEEEVSLGWRVDRRKEVHQEAESLFQISADTGSVLFGGVEGIWSRAASLFV